MTTWYSERKSFLNFPHPFHLEQIIRNEIIMLANLTPFKQNSKKYHLNIISTLPLHLTSHTAAVAKEGFWKTD